MIERLKELRKALKLSQAAFGDKIGIKQSTMGDIESGKNKLSERNFEAICRVFNVNPEWLREGKGEMFAEPKDGIEKLREEYNLNDGDIALIKSFLELPAEMRQAVLAFGRNLMKNLSAELEEMPPDDKMTVEQKRQIMNAELDAEEKGQMSYPSIGTSGLKRNRQKG